MATIHPHDEYAETLSEVRKKYLGDFDTGLLCVCGVAKIIDHASSSDPNALPRGVHDIVFGPSPSWRDMLDAFKVYHAYYCESCGLTYRGDVVERTRGYRPREVQVPPLKSSQVPYDAVGQKLQDFLQTSLWNGH